MPTYAELAREPWWPAEVEAPAHAQLNRQLRAHFGHTPAQTGSKGDNRHLRGRHRSRDWCLNSVFCTNRAYGTTDPRDKRGDGNWLRATDVGITGATLRGASARLDALVRSGRVPGLAEWFGTIDGTTVTGWYEGRPSSSDDSHLWHLHFGVWTEYANDTYLMGLLYTAITGVDDDMDMTTKITNGGPGSVGEWMIRQDARTNYLANVAGLAASLAEIKRQLVVLVAEAADLTHPTHIDTVTQQRIVEIAAKLDALPVDVAQELQTRLAE